MLENWPTAKLAEMKLELVSLQAFQAIVAQAEARSDGAFIAQISPGGTATANILRQGNIADQACAEFRERYYKLDHHDWTAQSFVLLNRPCYVVPETGVVILEDGRILAETLYPSTGPKTVDRFVGGGLTETNLEARMQQAEQMPSGTWAPCLPRWSNVYFHAVSEALVQDAAFSWHGISPHVTFPIPDRLRGSQNLISKQVIAKTFQTRSTIIKVPRLVFSTLLYQHATMGHDFLEFVNGQKRRTGTEHAGIKSLGERIYVSRMGADARKMTNEVELGDGLNALGFRTISGEGLSFDEQIRAFADAKVIVGAHGAGLLNAAFATPAATLFELRPLNRQGESPMWGMAYLQLSSIMQFRYLAHVSNNAPDSESWTANVAEILSIVREFLIS